jgi:hypothetical protein
VHGCYPDSVEHFISCSTSLAVVTACPAILTPPPSVPLLLLQVSIGVDPRVIFKDADWALMIGAKPRGPGQERADLLDQNGRIFVDQVGSEGVGCRI